MVEYGGDKHNENFQGKSESHLSHIPMAKWDSCWEVQWEHPTFTLTWSFVKTIELEILPSAFNGFQSHLVIGTTGCQREERSWRRMYGVHSWARPRGCMHYFQSHHITLQLSYMVIINCDKGWEFWPSYVQKRKGKIDFDVK